MMYIPLAYALISISRRLLLKLACCSSLPLAELLGEEESRHLVERLNNASDSEKMIAVMNEFLLSQFPAFEIAPAVAKALDFIHQHKGNVSIKDIETHCYISARSLERHFKQYIGLSPKEYAKIFRFKCLVNFINQNPDVTWASLCEQNGYYDQSHLTRYFSRYLKVKPSDIVNLDMDFITYLLQNP